MNHFGALIRAKRQAKGWSLRGAAARISLSPSRLAEIERGISYHTERATRPTADLVERIARVYDISVDLALTEAGYSPYSPSELSADSERLVAMFESLPGDLREVAFDLVQVLVERASKRAKT